jgi:hypothetical protein
MDSLFRISPTKAKAVDGSGEQIIIEHRVGKLAGAYTTVHLMDKLGLEEQYTEYVKEMQRKIRDEDRLKEILAGKYRVLKSNVTRIVSDYRTYLEKFYANRPRPLTPMFAFVPFDGKDDALFIQGLQDSATLKLVIGKAEDDAAWCEKLFTKTKPSADMNRRAEQSAKALLSHPGLEKDLRFRVGLIAQGKLPEMLTYGGTHDDKK